MKKKVNKLKDGLILIGLLFLPILLPLLGIEFLTITFIRYIYIFLVYSFAFYLFYNSARTKQMLEDRKKLKWYLNRVYEAKACPYIERCVSSYGVLRNLFFVTEDEKMNCLSQAYAYCPLYKDFECIQRIFPEDEELRDIQKRKEKKTITKEAPPK